MMDDEHDEDPGYEMVMPFLPVQSKGGPHNDAAFVAGYQMGLIDAQLGGSIYDQGRAINAECREQADLIAMRHGYIAEFSDEEVDGWVCMTLRRAVPDLT